MKKKLYLQGVLLDDTEISRNSLGASEVVDTAQKVLVPAAAAAIPSASVQSASQVGVLRARLDPIAADDWWNDLSAPACLALDARRGVGLSTNVVTSWADKSGCGSNATPVASPTYEATGWSDGGPCVVLNGSTQYFTVDGIVGKMRLTQERALLMLLRMSSIAGTPALAGVSGADGLIQYQSYSQYGYIFHSDLNPDYTSAQVFDAANDKLVVFNHADGANASSVIVDGIEYLIASDRMGAAAQTPLHATIGCAQVAGTYVAANFAAAKIRHVSEYSARLSVADYREACRRLLGGRFTRIIGDGNSLMQGGFGGGGNMMTTLQAAIGARSGGRFALTNIGIGGQNTQDMIGRYAAQAAPLYSTAQDNIYVAWELSNQLLTLTTTGDTLAVALQKCRSAVSLMWQLLALARATGFSTIVMTATYREAAGYTTLSSKAIGDACVDELNRLVREEWSGHADALADVQANPFFAAKTSSAINTADGTHLTQSADDIAACVVLRQVRMILDRVA